MQRLKQNKLPILLFIIGLIPLLDLFKSGLFIAHDSPDHVARIANFYQNLQDGNFIPRWAPNLNWGYGHPILMFLYPLPSYIASLFHFFGFSLVDATKIVFGLGFMLSGITMYLWINELWGKKAGFVSGLLYMFAPYRFVDLYVRGAIGENFFFIWPPLVLFFFTKLSEQMKWKYVVGGSLSFAAMILSHNALSLMFMPFIVVYGLLVYHRSLKGAASCATTIIFGFGLSAFFWIPAFFEGKYTLRNIVTGDEILERFETFRRLIYLPWNYGGTGQFSVQVGIVQWMLIILAPVIIYKLWHKKANHLTITSLITFWIAIFLILPLSTTVYQKITILQKFQFPWRWLSLAIFPPAIFGGALVYLAPRKYKLLLVTCCVLLVTFLNRNYWQAKGYSHKPDSFYSRIYYGTTDTGESAPIWSVRFMLNEPKAHVEVIEGKVDIKEISRKSTEHIYKLNVKSDKARLVENTLYFPGWFVYIDGNKLSLNDLSWQDPNYRGLMTFWVDRGAHEILVEFTETRLRLLADIITIGSLIIIVVMPFMASKIYDVINHITTN